MGIYKENPLLSVIVPVYNVEEYIEECLDSIVTQNYPNLEIIVINDGSTDRSLSVIKAFADKYENIIVYDKPNGGLSDTRNYGLDRCKGDFITFIDADDVLLDKNIYSQIFKRIMADKEIDVVQFDVVYKWRSKEEHKREYPFREYIGNESIIEGYLKQWIHVSCCDKVFRSHVFKNIRFPKGEISEDIAIIPQLVMNIRKILVTNIGFYGYRYREGSISTGSPDLFKIFSILRSYNKYISFCMEYSSIRSIAMKYYSTLIWNYTSTIRQNYRDKLVIYYKQKFFIKIPFYIWFRYNDKSNSFIESFKSFVSCVLGPKSIVLFQNLFTHNR